MNKWLYPKLAANNIQNNAQTCLPYMLACVLTAAMYYMICSLAGNPGMAAMHGGADVSYSLRLGTRVTAIFAVIFLFYTNSFLMKRRKKEFGLYNILGMEKRHISRVLGFEALYIAAASLLLGLIVGMVFDRLIFLILLKMLDSTVPLGFYISAGAAGKTVLLFAAIFLLIFLNSLRQIHLSRPIELLKSGSTGEKEPKTKWIMTVLGIACLGGGYYISVTTTNPVAAIGLFFVAVILVIIGTYFLFVAGSIALLKLLRKNKKYYYNRKHFTGVSGMIYRMKQNAVGLANICILSTMVLVMVSTTLSLWIGMEDILHTRYPQEIVVEEIASETELPDPEAVRAFCRETAAALGLTPKNELAYTYLSFSALEQGDTFGTDPKVIDALNLNILNGLRTLFFISLPDYNAITGEEKSLAEGEILFYANRNGYAPDRVQLLGKDFRIREKLADFPQNGSMTSNISDTYFLVVQSTEALTELTELQTAAYQSSASLLCGYYGFDLDGSDDRALEVYDRLVEAREDRPDAHHVQLIECRAAQKDGFIGEYGGLFFIGIFLGVLFLMATILIIYYKQISEGYEDKARYEIMQKVGMSRAEIKRSIGSQVLTVFFLPLVTAGVHVAFAFPVITRLLALLNLTNISLFGICTVGCFLVFAVIYALIYSLTARVYYRIVSR